MTEDTVRSFIAQRIIGSSAAAAASAGSADESADAEGYEGEDEEEDDYYDCYDVVWLDHGCCWVPWRLLMEFVCCVSLVWLVGDSGVWGVVYMW